LQAPNVVSTEQAANCTLMTECQVSSMLFEVTHSHGMSGLLQTVCKKVKQGKRNFKQQRRHIGNEFVFHFLLRFNFQPPFQVSPSFTLFARVRGFTAIAVLLVS
jgi:hypothetical protein